jgi:Cupredoxin-like domain
MPLLASAALGAALLMAEPTPTVILTLSIERHCLVPNHLEVPAGSRVELHVENHDTYPEEIESYKLNREQVVRPGRPVVLYLGVLSAGRYDLSIEGEPDSSDATLEVR